MAFINTGRRLNLAGTGSRKVALRRALEVLLGLLLAAGEAGCGQPPPSNDAAGGAPEGETTAGSGDTTGEVTEERTTEETTTEETTAVEVGGSPELAEAAEGYEEYVVEQTALLEDRTRPARRGPVLYLLLAISQAAVRAAPATPRRERPPERVHQAHGQRALRLPARRCRGRVRWRGALRESLRRPLRRQLSSLSRRKTR
jgi:hypothetical protein